MYDVGCMMYDVGCMMSDVLMSDGCFFGWLMLEIHDAEGK
jgi:hypothetical protein